MSTTKIISKHTAFTLVVPDNNEPPEGRSFTDDNAQDGRKLPDIDEQLEGHGKTDTNESSVTETTAKAASTTNTSSAPPPVKAACGSLNDLSGPDWFWSGSTVNDLCFNDIKVWRHIRGDHSDPNERHPHADFHRTTIDDIYTMFSEQTPPIPLFRLRYYKNRQRKSVPVRIKPMGGRTANPTQNGWALTYLDGSREHALEFRDAMLYSFPPAARASAPGGGAPLRMITLLEVFVARIPDQGEDDDVVRKRLDCPKKAKVLAAMRVHHMENADPEKFREVFMFHGLPEENETQE